MGCIDYTVILFFLLVLSAFFSASETAYSSLTKPRLKAFGDEHHKSVKVSLYLFDHYDRLISSILLGNNLVNIMIATIGSIITIKIYGEEQAVKIAPISALLVTALVLIFGEITPKTLAKDHPESFAIFSAGFLSCLIWILMPFCYLCSLWKTFLSRMFHLQNNMKHSPEELMLYVDEVQQEGAINQNESTLLKNAIEFSQTEVREIATPRVKLFAVDSKSSKKEIAKMFYGTKHSRLLVYEDTIDNIIGIIHLKNFYTENGITEKSLRDLLSPVIFVTMNEKICSVLKKLQKLQLRIAVVNDEFGGTYGIVSMEDILEELVGEMWDELENATEPFIEEEKDLYRVDASVDLEDFSRFFSVEIDSAMVSLAGWVAGMTGTGNLPKIGDTFTYKNLQISVWKMKNRGISSVKVKIFPKEESNESDGDENHNISNSNIE